MVERKERQQQEKIARANAASSGSGKSALKAPGIYRTVTLKDTTQTEIRVADFSYHPNDSLAQMIVDAWVDQDFRDLLVGVTPQHKKYAKASLAARGLYFESAVVISEMEYNSGYSAQQSNEVVFVLPDADLAGMPPPGQSLLETARLLMAVTPNGI